MRLKAWAFFSPNPESIDPFRLFDGYHLMAMACVATGLLLVAFLARRAEVESMKRRFRRVLFWAILLSEAFYKFWRIVVVGSPIRENLSLNLCGAALILCLVLLSTEDRRLFEVLYFWGIAGATQAILTPDIGIYGYPHYRFFQIFFSHGLILAVVVYCAVAENLRPSKGSLVRVFLLTNLYMGAVAVVNLALGTNYLYICQKPQVGTLMDHLGPWPFYILPLEILALALFALAYLPVAVGRRTDGEDQNSLEA